MILTPTSDYMTFLPIHTTLFSMIKHPLYPALFCNFILRYFVTSPHVYPIPGIPCDLCIGVDVSYWYHIYIELWSRQMEEVTKWLPTRSISPFCISHLSMPMAGTYCICFAGGMDDWDACLATPRESKFNFPYTTVKRIPWNNKDTSILSSMNGPPLLLVWAIVVRLFYRHEPTTSNPTPYPYSI